MKKLHDDNVYFITHKVDSDTEEEYYQRMEKLLSFATDLMIAGVSDIRRIFDMILDNIETQLQFVDMKFGENMNVIFMLIQSIMRNKKTSFRARTLLYIIQTTSSSKDPAHAQNQPQHYLYMGNSPFHQSYVESGDRV